MTDADAPTSPEEPDVTVPEEPPKAEPATIEDLLSKPAAGDTVLIQTPAGPRSLRLLAIGGEAYDELEAKHPPDDGDTNSLGMPLRWNPRTFPPAIVAACLVEPVLSEAEVRTVFASPAWSKAELDRLFDAAYRLNNETSGVVLAGKGSSSPRA